MPSLKSRFDYVFWQNTLSLHQAPLLRALSDTHRRNVLLVATHGVSPQRQSLGWNNADYGRTTIRISASRQERRELVEATRRSRAHIFSGVGAYPLVDEARMALLSKPYDGHIAVFSESWDPRGIRGLARSVRARVRIARQLAGVHTVLATGRTAYNQFRMAGLPDRSIVPFGYTVPPHPELPLDSSACDVELRLIFVGSLVSLKNVDLLFSALEHLEEHNWSLTVVGDGPLRRRLQARATANRWCERVLFRGPLSSTNTRAAVVNSDVLVLPSSYDGWGAVVNEALMSGVRVIVSDAAGASDLVVGDLQGTVFRTGDVSCLKAALTAELTSHHRRNQREALRSWATERISGEALAKYLVACLEHNAIVQVPPWQDASTPPETGTP